jgi:aromatic-amino-acid transaminase
VFVLHGCCHNPTGVDASAAQWRSIGRALARRNLLPLVDSAYHGLGQGLEADRAGLRILLEEVPSALVAYSCSKNFAIYRERVGALFAVGGRQGVELAASNLTALARATYSMPPDHGAAVVRTILHSEELSAIWRAELDAMRKRVRGLRGLLAQEGRIGLIDLGRLATQNGFFSSLAIAPADIARLRDDHGVYVVPSGRINIAGLREDQVGAFAAALRAVLA